MRGKCQKYPSPQQEPDVSIKYLQSSVDKLTKQKSSESTAFEAKVFILNDVRDDILTTFYKKSYGNKKGYEIFLEHVSLYDKTEPSPGPSRISRGILSRSHCSAISVFGSNPTNLP